MERFAAVSIDLDEIPCYLAIHGLPRGAVSLSSLHAVYDIALERASRFAERAGLPLTLFAIGRDLERPQNQGVLREMVDLGHDVESHSLSHRYDLSRLSGAVLRDEIEVSAQRIEVAVGRRPRGFRAPGYLMSGALFEALESAHFAWDSSLFPCPAYYAAKALVLAGMAVLRRPSASIVGDPRVLIGPRLPHRRGALVELPITVTRRLRFPVIGTSVGLLGARGARALAHGLAPDPFVGLELHGLDFLSAADGLEALRAHEPALRVSVEARGAAFLAFVDGLRERGFSFVTLDRVAQGAPL